jgi:hypothetical protein
MPRIGDQGDVLRALGRELDEAGASEIEILNQDSFLAVSWKTEGLSDAARSYREPQLATLRAQAQFLRSGGVPGATSVESLAELFRTLGQELDDAGIEMTAVNQVPGGFRVSGIRNGVYETHTVYLAELREASARHRLKRGTGGGRKPQEIDPFLGVRPGLPVTTRDNVAVGKVGDVQGRSFRVKTPLLQRDFWLAGSHVTEASPGRGVRLSLYRSDLDRHKLARPAESDLTVFHGHAPEP